MLAICQISAKALKVWSKDETEHIKSYAQQSQRQLSVIRDNTQHFWVAGFGRLQDALHNGFLWWVPAPAQPSQVEEAVEMLRSSRLASLEMEMKFLREDNDQVPSEVDIFSELDTLTLALVEIPDEVASIPESITSALRRRLIGQPRFARQLTSSC